MARTKALFTLLAFLFRCNIHNSTQRNLCGLRRKSFVYTNTFPNGDWADSTHTLHSVQTRTGTISQKHFSFMWPPKLNPNPFNFVQLQMANSPFIFHFVAFFFSLQNSSIFALFFFF